jgi:hypothetical protein
MIKRKLNLKNQKKYSVANNNFKSIPEKWCDFVKLLKIRSGNKVVNFTPYDYQIKLNQAIDEHYATIVCKSRQLGITQMVASKFLHKACLNHAYTALILSKTQDDTSKIAYRVREMLNSLTEYVTTENDNLTTIKISNGGQIFFRNSKIDSCRGIDSVSDVLFDECAFVPDMTHLFSAVIPCLEMVGDDARIVCLSTPNTQVDWYYEQLQSNNPIGYNIIEITDKIRKGVLPPVYQFTDNSKWCKFFIHWLSHPIYGNKQNYLEDLADKKKLPLEKVYQEYDLSFSSSLEMVFTPELIRKCIILTEYTKDFDDKFDYYLGIDTSTIGNDYFVANVLKHDKNDDKYSLVEMYRKRKQTSEYHTFELCKLIDKYSPKIAIETTGGVGQLYLEKLESIYPHHEILAVHTTGDTKPLMIEKLTLCLESNKLELVNDKMIIEEFLSFQRNGKKLESISGKHDDIVMSMAINVFQLPIFEKRSLINFERVMII